jgi:hypothetical protein
VYHKRFKYLFVGILAFAFLFNTLYNLVVLGDYALRYTYYAKVLCVNKDKPELKCNGSCKLAENMGVQEQGNAPSFPKLNELRVEALVPEFVRCSEDAFVMLDQNIMDGVFTRMPDIFLSVPKPPPQFC